MATATPIISPLVIYLLTRLGWVNGILTAGTAIAFVALGIPLFYAIIAIDGDTFEEEKESAAIKAKKTFKKVLSIFLVFLILSGLCPTKEEAIAMLVAKNVTYERLDNATEVVTSVYNDIIELIKGDNK